MAPKHKALAYNFISFALLFIIFRFFMGYFFPWERFVLAMVAAILASIMAPKFAVVKTDEGERIFVKWVFKKGPREL